MKISETERLVIELEQRFQQASNPSKAKHMAAYLKDHFKCFGIKTPDRHALQADFISKVKQLGLDHWDVCYTLWSLDQREFHYVAIDILRGVPAKKMRKEDYKNIEELILHHSWWDSVDSIATNYAGKYLQAFPEMRDFIIDRWKNSESMWLNRTCLIFQMKYGHKTDFDLLKELIRRYQTNREFFIQKAIGWSLRQYSKFNPDAVRDFVEEINLKGLAYREASKYLH